MLLDPADFVLDNLPPAPEAKATLGYWDFDGFSDKSGAGNDLVASGGCQLRKGALSLDGASSAATANALSLSGLAQATIECFVCLGETPSSGTLFSLGSGVGSFTVTADATAGTLSGSFIPYDHLAASNGGTAAPDPFAGRKVWHHVALVIDLTKPGADAVRFYVDYQRATPAGRAWDKAAAMLDGTLVVGAGSTQADDFFTGSIDDLRVSKGALSPGEFIQASERTEIPDGVYIFVR
ncbi:MAG: LamG domain-containing protein [Kiritimatiellae bacterium]|nr:LamG domain-containing protein [Kiritimatiellia bacterium]